MNKNKKSFLRRLDDKIFLYKVRFMMWKLNTRTAWLKWLHCNRGYHKLTPESLRIEKSTKIIGVMRCTFDMRWLRCINCNLLFFNSKKDREKYKRHMEKEEKIRIKMINIMLRKKT